jgi:argininosuccinate synthase
VTFDADDVYNQADAEGFIRLYGLPLKVSAMLKIEGKGVTDYETTDFTDFKRD